MLMQAVRLVAWLQQFSGKAGVAYGGRWLGTPEWVSGLFTNGANHIRSPIPGSKLLLCVVEIIESSAI